MSDAVAIAVDIDVILGVTAYVAKIIIAAKFVVTVVVAIVKTIGKKGK